MEQYLTASRCGAILDQYFVPHREQDEYTQATEETVKAVITLLAGYDEFDIQIDEIDGSLVVNEPETKLSVVEIIATVVVFSLMFGVLLLKAYDDDFGTGSGFGSYHSGGSYHSIGHSSFGGGGSRGGGAHR